eukprot:TRINITY_DN19014_c0_g1_i1.p1 TRINITY_DN19014_c0_g1~~TRINITY_DN19014_c0_g1_i1.p1  ORF type:complete len:1026 (+),score=312.70 TRINITY_DN19014_c0_g1_i1:132-3209(+)
MLRRLAPTLASTPVPTRGFSRLRVASQLGATTLRTPRIVSQLSAPTHASRATFSTWPGNANDSLCDTACRLPDGNGFQFGRRSIKEARAAEAGASDVPVEDPPSDSTSNAREPDDDDSSPSPRANSFALLMAPLVKDYLPCSEETAMAVSKAFLTGVDVLAASARNDGLSGGISQPTVYGSETVCADVLLALTTQTSFASGDLLPLQKQLEESGQRVLLITNTAAAAESAAKLELPNWSVTVVRDLDRLVSMAYVYGTTILSGQVGHALKTARPDQLGIVPRLHIDTQSSAWAVQGNTGPLSPLAAACEELRNSLLLIAQATAAQQSGVELPFLGGDFNWQSPTLYRSEPPDTQEEAKMRGFLQFYIAGVIPSVLHLRLVREVMVTLKVLRQKIFARLTGGPDGTTAGMSEELQELMSKAVPKSEALVDMSERDRFGLRLKALIQQLTAANKTEHVRAIVQMTDKLKECVVPEHAQTVLFEELARFASMPVHSQENRFTRNFIEWLCWLPWGRFSDDNLDVAHAKAVLDADHFGMHKVKRRILELIAVAKAKSRLKGKVLCFVGPPGVGKTSLGQSIARALNRKFYRFSVGGLNDIAEIKGHRRSYVGALPGKFIQALKVVATSNPVIMIDEIDKMQPFRGDPFAALLEVFDPEQNAAYCDHYLDVPFDVSNVLFIVTANSIDKMPAPLLDRMEVISLNSYLLDEKMEIARRHLLPKLVDETTLDLSVNDDALRQLITSYCREAGVRSLKKELEKIFYRTALLVEEGTPMQAITAGNLETFVGNPKFYTDKLYPAIAPPGIVCGLSYTNYGGSLVWIEAACRPTKTPADPTVTGQLGDVMKESTTIAFKFARAFLYLQDPSNTFFDDMQVHVHFPEGAVPKEGPSAGCAIATAFLSLATQRPVRTDPALPGEITATGIVLRVGGIQEKVTAAKRSGVTTLLLPRDNQREWNELPESLRADVDVNFVGHFSEAAELVFAPAATATAVPTAGAGQPLARTQQPLSETPPHPLPAGVPGSEPDFEAPA